MVSSSIADRADRRAFDLPFHGNRVELGPHLLRFADVLKAVPELLSQRLLKTPDVCADVGGAKSSSFEAFAMLPVLATVQK